MEIVALQHADAILELPIENVKSPSWILRPLDDRVVTELARSIQAAGLLQPVVVCRRGSWYELVFGNHRLEACRRLGMRKVPAVVKSFGDDEAFLARVSENLLRNSHVNPLEEAEGYRMLVEKGWTINAIGCRIGKSDSYVCERLAILGRLDRGVRSRVSDGRGHLTPSHAELISRIKDPSTQKEVATLVERKRLSVRALEALLNDVPPPKKIEVEEYSGECVVRLPKEFTKAVGISAGWQMYLYVRGRKLILENIESKAARKPRRRPSDQPSSISSLIRTCENSSRSNSNPFPTQTKMLS